MAAIISFRVSFHSGSLATLSRAYRIGERRGEHFRASQMRICSAVTPRPCMVLARAAIGALDWVPVRMRTRPNRRLEDLMYFES